VALVVLGRRIGSVGDPVVLRSSVRAALAALAMAVVAAPVAGAIGRSSPGTAFVATAVAGAAGALVYVGGLVALRSAELAALVALVRRRAPTPPGV
jgi:hypothetical protein